MSQSALSVDDPALSFNRRVSSDLHAMMSQGRSFSGKERHCVFLNTGRPSDESPRFADISASSGLDWPDDGRGVAIVDWDADGDLDMWISNRNAPRVRLMLNETKRDYHYVAFRLTGTQSGTNRDAIGARIEVHLTDDDSPPLIRTLRGGEGFISQSSKWIHFGLGQHDHIKKVVVRWPSSKGLAGHRETFSDVSVDGRFRLIQGRGKAKPVAARSDRIALSHGLPELPEPPSAVRIPAVSLFRMPAYRYPLPNSQQQVVIGGGKSVLINLWASWCQPCREELIEFSKRSEELRKAGIEVVALYADTLDKKNGNVLSAKIFLSEINFPFASRGAKPIEIRLLETINGDLVAIQKPLPVPSSFLLDPQGRIAIIYKGRVPVDQLLKDAQLTRRSLKDRWDTSAKDSLLSLDDRWHASAPLPGSLIDHQAVRLTARSHEATLMFQVGLKLLQSQNLGAAAYYFRQALAYRNDFADAHYRLGVTLSKAGDLNAAQTSLAQAVELDPSIGLAHHILAAIQLKLKGIPTAANSLRQAILHDPDQSFERGKIAFTQTSAAAKDSFGNLLTLRRELHQHVAWQLATAKQDELRNGDQAVRWATRLVELTQGRDVNTLATLAAAHAEVGNFDKALTVLQQAQKQVPHKNISSKEQAEMLRILQAQEEHYRNQRPYRDD